MEEGYAICFNEWVLDPSIKNDLRLLIIISSLTAEKGYCYASNKYLAEVFNTTEETISRKIKNLENKNYITIDYEKRGTQIISRKIRLTKISMDRYQKYQWTIDENIKENNISIKNTSINNKRKYIKESFEELWELYPNKKGKTEAYKKFEKALKDGVSIETIKDGIQRYVAYIEAEQKDLKYVKYGSTWFNQRCWKDDYTITRKPTTKDLASKIDFMNFLKEDEND